MVKSLQEDDFVDRIVNDLHKNYIINDFSDFKNALRRHFNTDRGNNAKFTDEDIIYLFESQTNRDFLKEYISSEDYESLFGDGNIVQRQVNFNPNTKRNSLVVITSPKVSVSSYKSTKSYTRGKPMLWNKQQTEFLRVRKVKKLTPKQVISDYNKHFKNQQRTSSSIHTKYYRV